MAVDSEVVSAAASVEVRQVAISAAGISVAVALAHASDVPWI